MSKQLKTWPCLFLLLPVLVFLYYLFIKSVIPSTTVEFENQVCTTKECAVAAATLHQNMNEKIDPCDNFAEFVCGNYKLHHPLPDGYNSFDPMTSMAQVLGNKLKLLLEAPQSPTDKPWHTLVKAYYQKCMDSKAVNATGKDAIMALLRELGGWPMLNPRWTPFKMSSEEYIATVQKKFTHIFFLWDIGETEKNTSDWTLHLYPMKHELSSKAMTMLFHFLNVNDFSKEYEEMVQKFNDLYNSTTSEKYKIGPLSLLKTKFKHFDLEGYVRRLVKGYHTLSPDMTIAIHSPEFFDKLGVLISDKRYVANFANLLLALKLHSLPHGNEHQCIPMMTSAFVDPLTQMYVKDYFDRDAVTPKMKEMLSLIKQSLREMLNEASWLDDFTRQNAIKKLDAMRDIIGYPDNLFNETYMNEQWNISLPTPTEHYYELNVRVVKKIRASQISQLNDSPKFDKVHMIYPNAYHYPTHNGIVILSSMLEHPFYQPNVPDYVNYAGIGHVIGHEIMHGFDNQGREYNENGDKINWWTNETATHYEGKSQCFINRYNDHNIDGKKSLGENIADNVGISLIYDAYKKLTATMKPDSMEPALPGFEKYTVDQMFFILATSKFCDVTKQGAIQDPNDPHPRSITRALITMKNSKEYSDAFKCSKSDKMNPEEKCILW